MTATTETIQIQPVISYPKTAKVGNVYRMEVDVQMPKGMTEWLYDEEEFVLNCIVDGGIFFRIKTDGNPSIALHRFGGTYGSAKFLLEAVKAEEDAEITVLVVNKWGGHLIEQHLPVKFEDDPPDEKEEPIGEITPKAGTKWEFFDTWEPETRIDSAFLVNLPLIAAIFAYHGVKHPEGGHIADKLRVEIDRDFERDSALAYLPSNIVESCQNSPIAQNFNLSFAKNRTWNQVDRELKLKRLVLIWRQGEIAAPICIVQRNENSYLVCDENGNLSDKSFEKAIEEFYGNEGLSALFVQKLEAFSVPVVRVGWYDPDLFTFPVVTYTKNGERVERTGSARLLRERLGNTELEMVEISGGKFRMGSPEGEGHDDERPQHEVTVPNFFMGKYPVTQAQYEAVMGKNPSRFKENGANRPVEKVSWNNAKEFCRKLSELTGKNYRLPSEAEWEYACRAGTQTKYYFGDSDSNLDEFAWYGSNSESRTHEVGEKLANAFGLHDMHGNVWEWCEDSWHDNYKKAPTDGSAWVDKKSEGYVSRGGSWSNYAVNCRSAFRDNGFNADFDLINSNGFRVVSDIK